MEFNTNEAVYQKLEATCRITGISVYALRRGCRDGSIPHVVRAGKYLVNVPALLRMLEDESKAGGRIGA